MRKGLFYVLIAIISIGVILLNTVDSVKYLTCEDPHNVTTSVIEVTESQVTFIVDKQDNETFSDYVYHIEEGTLYVGIKYTMNPLTDNATSEYTIVIDLTEEIDTIVLKGGMEERIIYPE